ncbi:2-oxoglutarate and iron-dependent oxygenase domain-containing protein [Hyphobacterium sp. HN65]|uniref:2-oxoglutarate-dependent ethylene/succinate-forming enzyme n=1 Tax=Hyphobacterium lacteum TaxID=3116575 RepID=A0ABU7LSA9_9PROT|nr:2-oxoglutarate and iron-dependent oxygenase domain-containing protein [Hyphobacterium sp. HN65]MEE2526791.1 2-oxoglutarate and iron-dependent oxygenase domain-containing protein [Hyphobacterium sp. HN65]
MAETIPHLDLADFTSGDEKARRDFATRLVGALEQCGFITLEGHAVDAALIARSYEMAEAFFNLPEAEKRTYAGGLRGYTPFGREHAKDMTVPDLKEFWQIGYEAHAGADQNVWPDRPVDFREVFGALFEALESTGRQLLSAIAIGLEIEPEYFEDRVPDGTSLLRLIHYPPVPENADPKSVRAAAHEDINLITLLVAAQGAGLEIFTREGKWLPVNNQPAHLVVDTGDMMARITNGRLSATTHRVVNPAGPNVSRYSMPFFVQPREDVMLECLTSCGGSGDSPEPLTTGDFLNQRLVEIGLKK